MPENDEILDPAHVDDGGITNMGAAGMGSDKPAETPAKPDYSVSEDGNIVKVGDKTFITDAALRAERSKNKELADTLARLDPVMPEFEEFLKTRENRRSATTDRVARDTQTQDDKDYLAEIATAQGYYDEQNQPDLRRAQAHLNVIRREADRAAERHVKPVAESTTRDRAAINREKARGARFSDGQPIAGEQYVEAAMKALPDDYIADPNIANITQVIAAGLEYLDLRRNGEFRRGSGGRPNAGGGRARSGEPMYTERGRGRADDGIGEGGMSELDLAAARARGKSPEQWAKLASRVNSTKNQANFEDA
jgi:hypothetical protein